MDIYSEYAVETSPTKQEKMIRNVLIAAGILCLPATFLFWPMGLAGLVLLLFSAWYNSSLDYEYEYILCNDDLSVDKVIQKSRRKKLVTIQLADLIVFTNDPGVIKDQSGASKKTVAYANLSLPLYYVMVNTKAAPVVYVINCSEEMVQGMRRRFPSKCKLYK